MYKYTTLVVGNNEEGDFGRSMTQLLPVRLNEWAAKGWEPVTVTHCAVGQFSESWYYLVVLRRENADLRPAT